jgi:hypothetical protein
MEPAMPCIPFSIDVFSQAWLHPRGAPGPDDMALYLVLQPLLVSTEPGEKARGPLARDLLEYFTNPPADIGALLRLGNHIPPDMWKAVSPDDLVPVPFPPMTRIHGSVTWSGAPTMVFDRTLRGLFAPGEADAFAASIDDHWPQIAQANGLRPNATQWDELETDQRAQLVDWLTGLCLDLLVRDSTQNDPIGDALLKILDWPKDVPATVVGLKNALVQPAHSPRAAQLWQALRSLPQDQREKTPSPPSLPLGKDALKSIRRYIPGAGDAATHAAASHHHLLWCGFRELAATADQQVPAATRWRRCADGLRLLYGFGERLSWPDGLSNASPDRFMRVAAGARAARIAALAGGPVINTNAVSLLGQVIRIAPVAFDGQTSDFTDISLKVGGHEVFHDRDDKCKFLRVLRCYAAEVADWRRVGRQVRPMLQADITQRAGFAPRMARATQRPGTRECDVPASLLDLVEPAARNTPQGAPALVGAGPRRRGLRLRELHRPSGAPEPTGRQFVVGVQLRRLTPAAERPFITGIVYRLLLPSDLLETADVKAALDHDPDSDSRYLRKLLIDTSVYDLVGKLRPAPAGEEGWLIVADKDLGEALKGDGPWRVALQIGLNPTVIPDDRELADDFPFNVCSNTDAGDPPMLAIASATVSRVNLSVDRIVLPVEMTYRLQPPLSPMSDPDGDGLDQDMRQFNKLRITMLPDHLEDAEPIWLTWPDALLPVPLKANRTQGGVPYALQHLFDKQVVEEAVGGQQDVRSEAQRFDRWADPSSTDEFSGEVENQYAVKLPAIREDTDTSKRLPRGLAVDVRLISDLTAKPSQAEEAPLLLWGFATGNSSLSLAWNATWFEEAFKSDGKLVSCKEKLPLNGLRSLYEALLELRLGMCDPEAKVALLLEAWSFDCDRASGTPAIGPGMARSFMASRPLARSAGSTDDVSAGLLAAVDYLLNVQPGSRPDFADFRARAWALHSGGASLPADLAIPLATGWEQDKSMVVDATQPVRTAGVVRLGLQIERAPASVAKPPKDENKLDPMQVANGSWPADDQFGALRPKAFTELDAYLGREAGLSPAHRRLGWIHARPPAVTVNPTDEDPPDKEQPTLTRLFGGAAPFLAQPPDWEPPEMPAARLYLAMHGLVPVKPHPGVGDQGSTDAFLRFLIELAQGIIDGVHPDGLTFTATCPVAWLNARKTLIDALRKAGGVADRMATLLAPLDDSAELACWPKQHERDLAEKVRDFAAVLLPEARAALARQFAERPTLFTTCQAIGLLILDPVTFRPGLHGFRLAKRISESVWDVETFTADRIFRAADGAGGQLRFVLDLLEDARYDADFEIRRNAWKGENPADTCLFDQIRWPGLSDVLHPRGGALSRLGDAIINGKDAYPAATDDPAERKSEAELVHHNPEWRRWDREQPGAAPRLLHVLPTRRPPSSPNLVAIPSPRGPIGIDGDPRHSLLTLRGGELPSEAVFAPRVKCILGEKSSVIQPGAMATDQPVEWQAVDCTTAIVTADWAKGWHQVDTFLSHHFFLVEADPEDGNDDMMIRVDTLAESGPAAAALSSVLSVPPHDSTMLAAFDEWRRGQMPAPLEVGDTARRITDWFLGDRGADGEPTKGLSLLCAQSQVGDTGQVKAWSYAKSEQGWSLTPPVSEQPGLEQPGLIACDQFKIKEGGASSSSAANRRLLRVTVLEDGFQRRSVRVLLRRNARDVDGDGDPDINPVFIMRSDWSEASIRPARHLELGPADFAMLKLPPEQRNLIVQNVGLKDWLEGARDIGPIISTSMRRPTVVQGTQVRWWGDVWLTDAVTASVTVRQVMRDAHPLIAGSPFTGPTGRDDEIPRWLSRDLPGCKIDDAIRALPMTEVPSHRLHIRIEWRRAKDAAGSPLMVLTWPLLFERL